MDIAKISLLVNSIMLESLANTFGQTIFKRLIFLNS